MTVWTDTLVTLTDLRGEHEPWERRLLTWPARNYLEWQVEYFQTLTAAAQVVLEWRGPFADPEDPRQVPLDAEGALRMAKEIVRSAIDGPTPSHHGADCTLVVTRVRALNGPPEPRTLQDAFRG